MYTVKSKIEIKVTEDDIADILAIAFEGGITGWCNGVRCENDENPCRYYSEVLAYTDDTLVLSVIDDPEPFELTREKLINGINKAHHDGYYANYEWVRNGKVDVFNVDAAVADVIVQLSVFDNVVYG